MVQRVPTRRDGSIAGVMLLAKIHIFNKASGGGRGGGGGGGGGGRDVQPVPPTHRDGRLDPSIAGVVLQQLHEGICPEAGAAPQQGLPRRS